MTLSQREAIHFLMQLTRMNTLNMYRDTRNTGTVHNDLLILKKTKKNTDRTI